IGQSWICSAQKVGAHPGLNRTHVMLARLLKSKLTHQIWANFRALRTGFLGKSSYRKLEFLRFAFTIFVIPRPRSSCSRATHPKVGKATAWTPSDQCDA